MQGVLSELFDERSGTMPEHSVSQTTSKKPKHCQCWYVLQEF